MKITCKVLEPSRIIYHAFSDYRAYRLVGQFKELNEAKKALDSQDTLENENKRLLAEQIKIEEVCVCLPDFDANGAGDCADRQIAAIKALQKELEETESSHYNLNVKMDEAIRLIKNNQLDEAIEILT